MVQSVSIVKLKPKYNIVIIHFMTKWTQVTEKIVYIILMNRNNTFDFSYYKLCILKTYLFFLLINQRYLMLNYINITSYMYFC